MSMKRSRRSSGSSRSSQEEGSLNILGASGAPAVTWAEHVANQPDEAFKPYSMSATFARNDLVQHAKFGRGIVTLVEGTRVEVLFEDGPRKLGHAG